MTDGQLQRGVAIVLVLGVLLALAANGVTVWSVVQTQREVHDLAGRNRMPETLTEVPIAEASWRSGGILIVVKTPREAGQTAAQWAAAHKANVDAMLVQFPKDP